MVSSFNISFWKLYLICTIFFFKFKEITVYRKIFLIEVNNRFFYFSIISNSVTTFLLSVFICVVISVGGIFEDDDDDSDDIDDGNDEVDFCGLGGFKTGFFLKMTFVIDFWKTIVALLDV